MSEAITSQNMAKEGHAAYKRGDFSAAARAFEAAAQSYLVAGDTLNAAELANNASVAYLQAGENEAALQAAEGTADIFAAAGDTRRQGMALGNLGSALDALDRRDEAAEAYQQSADLLKQCGEDQLRATVMQSLSTLQMRQGKQLQALSTMQSGLEDVRKPSPKQRFLKRLLDVPSRLLNK